MKTGNMTTGGGAVLLMCLLMSAAPSAADSFKSLAKDLSRKAGAAGVQRVVVLPFQALSAGRGSQGRFISEQLTTRMAELGRVAVVERAMLDELMSEHKLGLTGALEGRQLARLGGMLQAQAALVGTYAAIGNVAEVQARLVDIQSGAILGAAKAKLRGEWVAGLDGLYAAAGRIEAQAAAAEVLAFQRDEDFSPQRLIGVPAAKTLSGQGKSAACPGISEKVDLLEAEILHLKARHWGRQIAMGKARIEHARQAGSIISDPGLRARYFSLLAEAADDSKPLSMGEVARFIETDGRAFGLHNECSAALVGRGAQAHLAAR